MKQCDTLNMFFFYTALFFNESRVQGKCIATHTNQDNSFFKGKRSCLGGTRTHDTPLMLFLGQLSRQGSKSTTQHNTTQHNTTQHNTRQSQTPILLAMAQIAQKNPHLICVMISGIPNYGHIHSGHYAHVVFPYVLRMCTSR